MEWFVLVVLLGAGWFWLDSLRARDAALDAGQRACEREGFQFLDWTVVQRRVRLGRDAEGQVRVRRVYGFEFSDTGNNRLDGAVTLLGHRVESVALAPGLRRDGNVISMH
ncbi:MAG: DUF3301 domain-containing protein [Burkholderiales bacterium]|nr:DUF3301 domain-containing protein [Burkholderiales bacterium]